MKTTKQLIESLEKVTGKKVALTENDGDLNYSDDNQFIVIGINLEDDNGILISNPYNSKEDLKRIVNEYKSEGVVHIHSGTIHRMRPLLQSFVDNGYSTHLMPKDIENMLNPERTSSGNNLTELRDARGNYEFDFEEWDNTDIAGMNAEVEIDNLIGDWKELIKKEVEREAVGTGVDIEDVKRKAAREISRLWIEKIKRDLKF